MAKKIPKETSDASEDGKESSNYVVGQVSGCLFPKTSATGSGSLSALFSTNTTASNTVVFVPAPKHVPTPVIPKAEPAPADETAGVKPTQTKKNKKAKSAAELKVQDRESGLQTADDEDGTRKGPKKAAKRKTPQDDDDDAAPGQNGKPAKRKMTFKDFAAERVKLNRTVFVGNLPASCTREKLRAIFKEHGSIESIRFRSVVGEDASMSRKVAAIQRQVHPKKQTVNAYIVFKETEGALDALKKNGLEIQKDVHIRVDKASSKQHDHKRSIFVGNLPYDVAELSLRQHFLECGEVEAVRLIRDRATGMGKGFGYVLFESGDSVQLALKLDGSVLCERKIRVKRSVKDGAGAGAGAGKEGRGKGPGKGNKKGVAASPNRKGPSAGPMKKAPKGGPPAGPMKKGPKGGPPNAFPRGGPPGGKKKMGFHGRPGKKMSPSEFKGEMADPAAKKHKGQKKKSKPRKPKKNIHFG
ncbi:RNA-binding protein 34 [Engraulis encrasicolus]|uniref:RNA-binding protein 34 n=1 Tax=Engraulis encrasicolus TaxID=184585 RepID=UPI002FD07591